MKISDEKINELIAQKYPMAKYEATPYAYQAEGFRDAINWINQNYELTEIN